MWFEIAVGLFTLGEFVYHRWIEEAPPPRVGAMALPGTDEGVVIPLVYGTCRVRAPVLAWAGNWFPEVTAVVTYHLNMLWLIGAPFFNGAVSLSGIYVNNFRLTLVPSSTGGVIPGPFLGQSIFVTSNGFQ